MFTLERELLLDFWRRGRCGFVTIFVGLASLVLLGFGALQAEGGYDPTSQEAVQMHVTFALVLGFCAMSGAVGAQGKLARFFVRPISTTRLVVCQLTFGMAAVAGLYVAYTCLLNLIMGTQWPLWGPALFFATALACAQAAIWWTEGSSNAQVLACSVVAPPLAVWFSRRYGATVFGDWQFMWTDPTLGELGTLVALTAAAYVTAVVGVARNRRGEGFDFSSAAAWFAACLARSPRGLRKFRSPWQAQVWYEWRQKLGGAPALLSLLMLTLIVWRLGGVISSQYMMQLLIVLPLMSLLLILPLVYGLVVGNCGSSRSMGRMTPLLATRPLSDSTLAAVSLYTGALALLAAWCVWMLGLAAGAAVCLKLEGSIEFTDWNRPFGAWTYLWAALLALLVLVESWALLGLVVALTMTGRPYLLGASFGSICLLGVAIVSVARFFDPSTQTTIQQVALALIGLALMGALTWFVARTRRCRLVPERTTWLVAVSWFVLTMIGITLCAAAGQTQLGWLLQVAGASALVVVPFVSAPLALASNRHA